MATAIDTRLRRIGRGTFVGGMLATLSLHAAIGALVYYGHMVAPPPVERTRDLMVTQLVSLGKPADKRHLPRIVQPPRPTVEEPQIKVATDPNAPPQPKQPPKPDDAQQAKDLKRALERAKALAQANVPEEPPEGSLTGSALGTSTQASVGDEYATAIYEAIRRNWVVPTGLSRGDMTGLTAAIRVAIAPDGSLQDPSLLNSSGNDLFDDSCMQAVRATGRVPPPPAAMRAQFGRGLRLDFEGKDLAR